MDKSAVAEYNNLKQTAQQLTLFDLVSFKYEKEKNIVPVRTSVWDDFKFIDLFAGIGGIRLGFEHVGGQCVFSSEWDEQAAKTYEANFGERPAGDITKIASDNIPDFDMLLGGFPCQPFSIIGDKAGFNHETQGTLFFEIERILCDKRPKAFMLENVRNLTVHDGGKTFNVIINHLKALGYNVYSKVLNALDFGVPQKRERIIICGFIDDVNFTFPCPVPKQERLSIADILENENDLDAALWVRDNIKQSRFERMKTIPTRPYITHENVGGMVTPHYYSCALRAGASSNYILVNNERRPSAREMLRLQGFPDTFKVVVPYSGIKKQTGNSVAVPVIKAVAEKMLIALKNYEWENAKNGR
ncbi:MAG: DNA (cytosine-5-)-methyltransferase [Campylobacteraceae bacterium]|jgi:DNA (cytosine-5)-methyltransferase 1|nr:DNA (cytosine-5-)-methyltransferase [Campylobacteraceae bacterium]